MASAAESKSSTSGLAVKIFARAARARGSSSTMRTRISAFPFENRLDLGLAYAAGLRVERRHRQAYGGDAVFTDAKTHGRVTRVQTLQTRLDIAQAETGPVRRVTADTVVQLNGK